MNRIYFPIYLIWIFHTTLIGMLGALPTETSTPTTSQTFSILSKNSSSTGMSHRFSSILHKPVPFHHHNNQQYQSNHHHQQHHNVGYLIANCLSRVNISNCMTKLAIDTIDLALRDNHTWSLSPYVAMVPNSDWQLKNYSFANAAGVDAERTALSGNNSINQNDLNVLLLNKIKNFAESRSIRVSLIPKELSEARSKKGGKDKGGAMVGVMVMIGVMAQMFMGKVMMLAGGAFLISKLALLFSILSGLKKSGGGSDHVIYTESSGGHGGGHSSGWNRQLEVPPPYAEVIQRKNF